MINDKNKKVGLTPLENLTKNIKNNKKFFFLRG